MSNSPRHTEPPDLGATLELDIDTVAHGGHCVGRFEGRAVFVRHTLPGERVKARVTDIGKKGRFLRADAVHVLRAAPGRVATACPWSGPGLCGGCDWQHVDLATTRELKTQVLHEQFERLAGLNLAGELGHRVAVQALDPLNDSGSDWRTRVRFAVDEQGQPGLRGHRSHEVIPVDHCLIAHPRVERTGVLGKRWPGTSSVDVVAPSADQTVVADQAHAPKRTVRERVSTPAGPREFNVAATGFWQVHPQAPATFVSTVMEWARPEPGEHALDLYAGVGLFALPLAEAVGPTGSVTAVELDRPATECATENLRDVPWARVRRSRVDAALRSLLKGPGAEVDIVVLDPPRVGAGERVMADLARLRPRVVVYVACDPAALARDVGYAQAAGMQLADLRAYDAFPMTHHMETVALLHMR